MKCHQCEKPALYTYENGPSLCLHCNTLLQENNYRSFLMNAAMMNQSLDDMDMVTGLQMNSGRIPVSDLARAMNKPTTNNHISISNSSVGVLNTGDLAKINAVITITEGSDSEELGRTIRDFAQAVIDSKDISGIDKHEIGELLGTLSEQIAGKRSKPVISSILKGIEERVKPVDSLWSFAEKIGGLLSSLGITI
ncbi:hypothetical protein T8T21_00005 [Limimaricola variabilis]|uniref:hypothetical protein n=1 Tax=Limimaricola variabilis TaxID=1492771 RepID=UPI002AC934AB|nr:hypothetical protein [Limimaricola variabilis]WPY94547.1 hypothetical protein T8T21_00005 [Limimaricola variabilis]